MGKKWGSMRWLKGPKEELDAARSPDRSADELDVLAESQYEFVQTAVAEHVGTRPSTLAGLVPMSLAGDGAQALGLALAQNKNTPDYALAKLGKLVEPFLRNEREQHTLFEIGVALSCNSNTPFKVLSGMLDEERCVTVFRKVVARETRRLDVLRLLVEDRSESVRKRAALTVEEIVEDKEGE